ncbi:beta-ketoacyl [acyl carrier protein] synthase domain-containing protein [Streptomyces microflavus]|uniref:beta-ketoacyl [acyl carrier protein] synthase domain-containing protein n=1 Tax=Streptomyces microflavus TaxID=1919 RepID=UPI00382BBAAA
MLGVDNICPAGLFAIDLGMRHLISGESDLALCGGVSSHGPLRQVYFAKMGALSPSGDVRAFDENADGTAFSDGAAVVALKLLDRALLDGNEVLGILIGFGGASDGSGKAIFAPRTEGQTAAMRRALAVNNLNPSRVGWVVAHGTATLAGDSTESRSLAAVYPRGIDVTSDKSIGGHTGMACGVVSVIQVLNGLRRMTVPGQQRFAAAPRHAPSAVHVSPLDHPLRSTGEQMPTGGATSPSHIAGAFACGLGGINAHLLVQHPGGSTTGLVSGPARGTEEAVLVGWNALLPGNLTREEIRDRLLNGRPPANQQFFDDPYPLPPFEESRVSPSVARQVDRLQLMALSLVHSSLRNSSAAWQGLHRRTGAFGAHDGPTQLAADSTLRCFRSRLQRHLANSSEEEACEKFFSAQAERSSPVGPYTLAGRMPSVALGWIANRYDLHGPTMMLDCGPASGLAAVHVAADHLRSADLDVALVLGCNTELNEEVSYLSDSSEHSAVAEGLFLLVLARSSVARHLGWPTTAVIQTSLTPSTPPAPVPRPSPTYRAADGIIAILRAALQGSREPSVVTLNEGSPAITVTSCLHPPASGST